MAHLMSLPLTVSCFSKIQIGFTFLVPAHPGSPRQRAVKRVCVLHMCTVIVLCIDVPHRNFDALMDRFTHHLVKTSPAAESGSYSGIAADKVSSVNTR